MTQPSATESRGGRYAVHAEIGAGGMATVHLGRLVGARGFSRIVAIKVLHASYAKNKDFVERFLDEARIVGRIHHPNVMPTLDVISEGDDLRIVMDYVVGESLDQLESQMTTRKERIPPRIACAIIAGALHGLHAAHEAKNEFGEPLGIVHLDVSPQNILVGTDGTSRVLDFGVARARGDQSAAAQSGSVGGKSAYLAPEQVRGAEVTPRTDVFAASIVLWEMLTGESLFAADNHAATMQRVLGGVIPAVSEKVPDLPPRLDELLKIGLRRDPTQRFATARDMALELEQAIQPALPSEVGSWVETVAAATLVARAAKVQEMETQAASTASSGSTRPPGQLGGLVKRGEMREMYEELAAVNLSPDDLEDDVSSLMRPPGGKDSVPQRAADGSIRWQPRSAGKVVPVKLATPARIGQASVRGKKTGALPKKDRTVLWIALAASVLALGLFAFGARAMLLPSYIKSIAINTAATHGVTLTVTDASLADDGVVLHGLTARLADVPQVTCTIASADVKSIWSSPAKVVLGKTEIVVDGDVRAVSAALAAWSLAHRGKPRVEDEAVGGQVDMPNAHLVWTHASAQDVMRVEATGLSGAIGSPTSASLGDDVHFLSNALVLETKLGVFGPWNLTVDGTTKSTRARIAFDPAVPDGANALLVDDTGGDSSFDIVIPRLNAGGLGIPRTAFGPDVPFPQQLEVNVHYGRLSHEQTTGSVRAAMYGLRIPELGTAVDAKLTADAAGPTGSPMTVKNGLFTLGAMHAAITGTVSTVGNGVKAALVWKGDPIPCATLASLPSPAAAARDLTKKASEGDVGDLGQLARDFGALGEAMGAVKVTGAFSASGTFVADSTDLAHAKLTTVAKNACGLALFQSK